MSAPIPERLASRPRHGGMAVPYITEWDTTGRPIFRANNERRRQEVMHKRWCGMCGEPLDYWIVFIVGNGEEHRVVMEPAQHEECARYVMAACPYFAREGYEVRNREPANLRPGMMVNDSLKEPTGPRQHERVGLYFTRSYRVVLSGGDVMAAPAPAKRIEWVL